ncbi:hypothetical protein [Mucilaginibacter antarcticus]|uniref:hypothetical protein n=1 Tax=Mucilaginibacter antarcticus TaxID=1855725 RepID=UPI00363FED40
MKRELIAGLICCLCNFKIQAQSTKQAFSDLKTLNYTVESAPDWTNALIRQSGWFGGDGIFTIPMDGIEHRAARGKVLFIFSDSMIGGINDGKLKPGSTMIHNAVAILDGKERGAAKLKFYWRKGKGDKAESVFIPKTAKTENGDYLWLGDGFVNKELNNDLFIFAYRITNVSNAAFGFKEVGNVLIKIPAGDKSPYHAQKQEDTPFYIPDKGEGAALLGQVFMSIQRVPERRPQMVLFMYTELLENGSRYWLPGCCRNILKSTIGGRTGTEKHG